MSLLLSIVLTVLVIRLQRVGRKNRAEYRVVLAEKHRAVKKQALEVLGHYLPERQPKVIEIDLERAKTLIGNGAQPSETVASLLKNLGMEGMEKYMTAGKRKRPVKNPTDEPAAAAPASAPTEEASTEEEPAAE